MTTASTRRGALGLLLICASLAGCGPKPARFTDTVEGTLMRGKKPLAGVRVQFVPQVDANVQAPLSSATTDEKGYFKLQRDDNGQPGAAIGKHKITLHAGRMGGRDRDGAENAPGASLPLDYTSVERTPLEVEVKADQTNYPLEVKDAIP